jgi:hypothetical protein
MSGTNQQDQQAAVFAALSQFLREHEERDQQLLEGLNDIRGTLRANSEQLEHVARLVERHDEMLRGNGKVGLITRVENIEPMVRAHQSILLGKEGGTGLVGRTDMLEKQRDSVSKLAWVVIGSIVTTGVGIYITNLIIYSSK